MRISDWSSDVCSSDLAAIRSRRLARSSSRGRGDVIGCDKAKGQRRPDRAARARIAIAERAAGIVAGGVELRNWPVVAIEHARVRRSEEHTSELQSLMRISYAVFCLKKKNTNH